MPTPEEQMVVWEELDFGHAQPRRTATLAAQGSSFHLLREKGGGSARFWASLTSAFLPEGYPDSVTSDYLQFQFWDTLQGLSTYIRSMISTQALLSGIGVGQTTATVMGATFQWFLRDFTGMLGGVVFTIYQGSNLDSQAKQWRLAADFMNDIANYKAVRCLRLTSLNKERTKITLQMYLATGKVLSPSDVSGREVLLPQFSSIKNLGGDVFHDQSVALGARISSINVHGGWRRFAQMVHRYSKGNYVIILQEGRICVVLHRHARREDFLKSYIHALVTASFLKRFDTDDAEIQSCVWMESTYSIFLTELQASGWNVNRIHVVPESWRAEWRISELKSE